MKKSWFVLFLAALLMLVLPIQGKSEEEYVSGLYTYYLEDGKAIISDYAGEASKVTIPSKLDGHPVAGIGYCAFFWNDSLTSVVIPKGAVRIEFGAFSDCENLTSVTIPSSVKTIESEAFSGCSSLTTLKLPAGLETIEDSLCKDCYALSSVTIPASVKRIADGAFSGCSQLKNLILPEGLLEIGTQAFMDCESLATIEIPKNVNEIADEAFSSCSTLDSVVFPENLKSIGDKAFYGCSMRTLKLPESLEAIGDNAFGYSNLASVSIPQSVMKIGDEAFSNCSLLLYAYLPGNTTEMGRNIFKDSGYVCIKGDNDSGSAKYAKEYGIPFVYEGISAEELCQAYGDGSESPEVFLAKWSMCPGGAGLYEQVMEILRMTKKTEEFDQLCSDMSAYADIQKDCPAALDYMAAHDISSLNNMRQAFLMSLMKAGLNDDLLAWLYKPSQEAAVGPVLWTDKALRDCLGKSAASFVPKYPRNKVCLLSMGDKSQIAIDYEDIYSSEQRSIEELVDEQVSDILYSIEMDSDDELSFTGNPHLAGILINFSVSYPLRGTYISEDDGHRIKGYNCKVTLTAYTMAKHKKIASVTLSSVLDDEIYVSDGSTKEWADLPEIGDTEELNAFIDKILAY